MLIHIDKGDNILKKILTLILALIMTLSATSLTGCRWNEFTVTFDPNGGVQAVGDTTSLVQTVDDAKDLVPPTFVRDGFEFDGWDHTLINIDQDTVVKALWIETSYIISFDKNGGQWGPGFSDGYTVRAVPGEKINGVIPTVVKPGVKFVKWIIVDQDPALNGKDFNTDGEFPYQKNITLQAVWSGPTTYYITYKNASFENGFGKTNFLSTDQPFKLDQPIKEGHTFLGWTTEGLATPQKNLYINPPVVDKNLEFTANWKANVYTLSFDNDGGTWSNGFTDSQTVSVTYGQPVSGLPSATKAGYRFVKWEITDDAELNGFVFNDKENYNYAKNLKLKIVWAGEGEILITYNGADSTGLKTNFEYTDQPFNLGTPTKKGYEFLGWTGEGYDEPTKTVTINPATVTKDLEFTANWRAIEYVIYIDTNGGTLDPGETHNYLARAYYGQIVTDSFPNLKIRGLKLIKWVVVEPGSEIDGETLHLDEGYPYTHDVIVMPIWSEPSKFVVTYKNATFTNVSAPTNFLSTDQPFVVPNPDERQGYIFLGWTGNGITSPTKEITIDPATLQGDLELTANWQGKKTSVILVPNGGSCSSTQLTFTYGQANTLPTLTREGYTFNGWFDGTEIITPGAVWDREADSLVLSAVWNQQLTVQFASESLDSQANKTIRYVLSSSKHASFTIQVGTAFQANKLKSATIHEDDTVIDANHRRDFGYWAYKDKSGNYIKIEGGKTRADLDLAENGVITLYPVHKIVIWTNNYVPKS